MTVKDDVDRDLHAGLGSLVNDIRYGKVPDSNTIEEAFDLIVDTLVKLAARIDELEG